MCDAASRRHIRLRSRAYRRDCHAHVVPAVSASPTEEVWLRAQSKHFTLVGDASEKEIRNAGTRLEQFRQAVSQLFSQLFSPSAIRSSVPITVIVFRNDAAYKPFKPLYQGKPADVSGHFQSSGDTAYIALTQGRSEGNPYAVIFHEYVHALTSNGARPLPTWVSEGLAEYFSAFEAPGGGNKVRLGKTITHHARLLREQARCRSKRCWRLIKPRPITSKPTRRIYSMPNRGRSRTTCSMPAATEGGFNSASSSMNYRKGARLTRVSGELFKPITRQSNGN